VHFIDCRQESDNFYLLPLTRTWSVQALSFHYSNRESLSGMRLISPLSSFLPSRDHTCADRRGLLAGYGKLCGHAGISLVCTSGLQRVHQQDAQKAIARRET